jgi:hypothetical protein
VTANPILDRGLEMFRAIGALKLKRGAILSGQSEGTVIRQQGKPDLLLTWEAAREFSNMVDEAEHGA